MNTSQKRIKYLLNSPEDLLERMKESAMKNQRSLNGELITAMEQYIVQQEQKEHLSP